MGLLVAYNAAMQRVLLGLQCMEVYECEDHDDDDDDEDKEEQGGLGSQEARDRREYWSSVCADMKASTGASFSPAELRAKCKPDGEFRKLRQAVTDAVVRRCESLQEYDLLDELDDGGYDTALDSAVERFAKGPGLTAADLKRPKTLPMMILKVAHAHAVRGMAKGRRP